MIQLQPLKMIAALSLSLLISACQTSGKTNEDEQALLNGRLQIARNSLDQGRPAEALGELRQLIREYPQNPTVQTLMGFTQLALGNKGKALGFLRKAFQLSPTVANGLNLSAAYIENRQYKRAIRLLGKLAKQAPKYEYPERIYHNLGYVSEKMKDTRKSLVFYKKALEENPTFYPAKLQLAKAYQKLGRKNLALQAYREAMDYCHVCYEPVESLARGYIQNGQLRHARDLLLRYGKIRGVAKTDMNKARKLLRMVSAMKQKASRTARR